MPVKIVAGSTNPKEGEINQLDLERIVGDFEDFAEIDSNISRHFIKKNYVVVPISMLQELIDGSDDYRYVNIHFGITLPDQKSCGDDFKTDISNELSVVIIRAKLDGNLLIEKNAVGDSVIVEGFKSNRFSSTAITTTPCCGNPRG